MGLSLCANYSKPLFSFPCLIGLALFDTHTEQLSVSQIYDYISKHYPYFLTAKNGWKNSVRHNLSMNKFFHKTDLSRQGQKAGKGTLWGIAPGMHTELKHHISICKSKTFKPMGTSLSRRRKPPIDALPVDWECEVGHLHLDRGPYERDTVPDPDHTWKLRNSSNILICQTLLATDILEQEYKNNQYVLPPEDGTDSGYDFDDFHGEADLSDISFFI